MIICSVIKCFVFEPKKGENKRWKYVALLVLVQLPVLTVKFIYAENAFIRYLCLVLFLVIYIAFFKRCFQCYLWQAILLTMLEVCCSVMTEILTQTILKEQLQAFDSYTLNSPMMVLYIAVGYIILPIVFLLMVFLFKRFVLKGTYDMKVFYIFSIFPISQIIMLLCVNPKFFIEFTITGMMGFAGIVVGFVADGVLLITLLRQQRMQEMSVKINEMEKTWEVEQNHYADIEARREEFAKIRHDLSEQFLVIQELLRKKDYSKVEEMVGILQEDVSGTREYVYCGDSVVNAIMAENERKCQEYGICFDYDLQIDRSLELNPVVICSIFSNLMRNAIAAARETTDKEQAFISVKADVKGDYLHIKVKNSYSEMPKKSKEDRKGYGLSILKAMADQYSGHMEQSAKDGVYSVVMSVENTAEK